MTSESRRESGGADTWREFERLGRELEAFWQSKGVAPDAFERFMQDVRRFADQGNSNGKTR